MVLPNKQVRKLRLWLSKLPELACELKFDSRVNLAPKPKSSCHTKLPLLIIHRLLKTREGKMLLGSYIFSANEKISYMMIQSACSARLWRK